MAFTCLPQEPVWVNELGQKPVKRKQGDQEEGEGGKLNEDKNEEFSEHGGEQLHSDGMEDENIARRPVCPYHYSGPQVHADIQQRKRAHRVTSPISNPTSSDSISTTHPHSPPRLTAKQKQKGRAAGNQLPTPSRTQHQASLQKTDRPGPSSKARRSRRQSQGTSTHPTQHQTVEDEDSRSHPSQPEQQAVERRWTHLAKQYGMLYYPWVSESVLSQALHSEADQHIPEGDPCSSLIQFFDEFGVGDCDKKHPQFQAKVRFFYHQPLILILMLMGTKQFLLGLRELRGEIISRLNGVAMEVLGFEDAPESQFRDEDFDKSQHTGFQDLLDGNKFLGVGDRYLCSDQIIKVWFIRYCCPFLD